MITLRDFKKTDIESLTNHANNENIARGLSHKFPHPFSRNDALILITTGSNKNCINKAIDLNGECIGSVSATFQIGEHSHSAELGYWLSEVHWGKGIATDALNKIVDHTFSRTNINRVFAKAFSNNKASIRVLEKCDFTLEGILIKSAYKSGQYLNEHVYARLKTETYLG